MLQVEKISAGYIEPILRAVDFSLADGERVALLGANGAGKTTLLLTLAGVIPLTAGHIFIDDISIERKNLPRTRQKIGLIMQQPDDQVFMPTVEDDIAFGLRNYGVPETKCAEKIAAIMADLQIEHLRGRLASKISGGEKRLVQLAGVLVMSPKILLLDEPATFLDPRGRRALMAILNRLSQTLLIATHDFDLARELSSRVIILKNGEIFADQRSLEILDDRDLLLAAGL